MDQKITDSESRQSRALVRLFTAVMVVGVIVVPAVVGGVGGPNTGELMAADGGSLVAEHWDAEDKGFYRKTAGATGALFGCMAFSGAGPPGCGAGSAVGGAIGYL